MINVDAGHPHGLVLPGNAPVALQPNAALNGACPAGVSVGELISVIEDTTERIRR